MSIGTSMGAYYDDAFHQAAAQWDPKYDDNEITPDKMQTNKAVTSDPKNITDDAGNIVDYDSTGLPSIQPMQQMPHLDLMPK